MKIKMLVDGESPQFGVFTKGEILDVPHHNADVLIQRGVAVAVGKVKETEGQNNG